MEEDTGGHTVMEEGLKFDYYYGVQSEQFSFYRIPRLLIKDQHFKGLSSDAKLLYGLMLDRMALSMKNHWLDNENRAYIIYSISNVMDDINCSKPTCVKIMKELDSFGLIERKRKGLGKPDIIYVKNFAVLEDSQEQDEESFDSADTFEENKPVMSNENITSEGKQDELPEVKDFNFNNEAFCPYRADQQHGRQRMENMNQLTEKDVTEILSQREELLEGYRKRLEMLSREYEDADELIGMLQMRSPGVENEIQAGGVNKGLDDIYLMYERQRKKYQEEIHQNMLQIMDLMDRIKHVYLYYLQLTPKEQAILKAIYIEKRQYKEIIKEGMSESSINRMRKRAIKKIIQRWEKDNQAER